MTTPAPTPGAASDASQPSDDLLSADDVARTLGVTKQTVSRLIRTGALPAEKVGNKWVIFADKLGAYLAANNLVPEPADHPRRPGVTPTLAGAPADAVPSLASDTSPAPPPPPRPPPATRPRGPRPPPPAPAPPRRQRNPRRSHPRTQLLLRRPRA